MNLRQLATSTGYSHPQLSKLHRLGLIRLNRLSDPVYVARLIPLLRVRKHIHAAGRRARMKKAA